jgi:hypothetical protein
LEASQEARVEAVNQREVYVWVTRTRCQQEYWKQSRVVRGMLRYYSGKLTGLSRVQVIRLINCYQESGTVSKRAGEGNWWRDRFASRDTPVDVELPAGVDEAHGTLCGPAQLLADRTCIRAICRESRACTTSTRSMR